MVPLVVSIVEAKLVNALQCKIRQFLKEKLGPNLVYLK